MKSQRVSTKIAKVWYNRSCTESYFEGIGMSIEELVNILNHRLCEFEFRPDKQVDLFYWQPSDYVVRSKFTLSPVAFQALYED
jgi:hypothetical protein